LQIARLFSHFFPFLTQFLLFLHFFWLFQEKCLYLQSPKQITDILLLLINNKQNNLTYEEI